MEAILPLSLIEPIFSVLTGNTQSGQNMTSIFNASELGTEQTPMPTDIMSLFTFITTSKAVRDYFKLIILGSAFETLRRMYYSASSLSFSDWFFITATFESDDVSFDWMMFWLSSLPSWRKARDFTISTSNLGLDDSDMELEDDDSDDENAKDPELRKKTKKVRYLPAYSTRYRLLYKRRVVWVSRIKEESRWYSDKSTLIFTILSRDRAVLDSLIKDAKKAWLSARQDKIDLYANEGYSDDWRFVTSRPQRPLNSIVLDDGVKELVIEDARDFLRSKQWYADRGIPFRRGYLLYGAPGSGKTSLIHSLAGELGLDIYILSLSKSGLDDSTLNKLISSLPERCIVLLEDIDAAFTHGLARNATGTELEDPKAREARQRDDSPDDDGDRQTGREGEKGDTSSRVSLSGLLNALDGVSAQEGRLLFATTNRYSVLDPALTRPGRMDLHVEFRLASQYQAKELYKRFYLPDTMSESKDDDDAEDDFKDATEPDSGYATPDKKIAELPDAGSSFASSDISTPSAGITGTSHTRRGPRLTKKKVERLASRFAAAIPEREFSMASLQGFLMGYKTRPIQAVEEVATWIQDARDQIERRARREKAKTRDTIAQGVTVEVEDT